MAADPADATLELTLLSIHGLKDSTFMSKPKAVAWVDPGLKKSTKTPLSPLHLPLSPQTLQNPRSSLTIQLLSSRLPFHVAKPIATGTLPLSSIPLPGEVLNLPLRRPSGRPQGSLRLLIRILWCLHGQCVGTGASEDVEGGDMNEDYPAYPTAPPIPDEFSDVSEDSTASGVCGEAEDCSVVSLVEGSAEDLQDGKSPWRSFMMGLISGTVAVVLVGVSAFSGG